MDGFQTYIIHYQDVAGHVFTDRIISNNPAITEETEQFFARFNTELGYHLMSIQKVEEMATHVANGLVPLSRTAKFYRGLVAACVVLTVVNIGYDLWAHTYTEEQREVARAASHADRAAIIKKLADHDRLLNRMDYRQERALDYWESQGAVIMSREDRQRISNGGVP